jgi:hypothetical protein
MNKVAVWIGCVAMLCIFAGMAFADDGILRGHAADMGGKPISGADLLLESHASGKIIFVTTDENGKLYAAGMLPGVYTMTIRRLGYKSIPERPLLIEPGREIFIRIILALESSSVSSSIRVLDLDYSGSSYQTFLSESRIHDMPAAHNIWALVENQDLSAISNRIDVGGWWNGFPGLFSSRGSCSWTQNRYLLNGMDVTDPYQTGKPLFYPDYFSIHSYNLINAGHPPGYLYPGGYLDLMSLPETRAFHGGISGFFIHDTLQSSNISTEHQSHGLMENHTFNSLSEGNIHFSGPLIPDRLLFSGSLSAFDLSRDVGDFPENVPSSLLSGLFSLKADLSGHEIKLLWTGQNLHHPVFGADRDVPYSATNDNTENYHVYQLLFRPDLGSRHHITAGIGFSRGDSTSAFQAGVFSPYAAERFKSPVAGTAPDSSRNVRNTLTLMLKGLSFLSSSNRLDHVLRYGFQLQRAAADSEINIFANRHLHFFKGKPLEIAEFDSPYRHRESGLHGHIYVQDTLSFSNLLSIYAGGVFSFSRAWGVKESGADADNEISWMNFAPRFGVIIPLDKAKTSVFKFSFQRYHFTLPLSYLSFGHPDAPGAQVYVWHDSNQDNLFQPGEKGRLWRREGPAFAEIDPKIKRPYMDEAALSYQTVFGKHWSFTLAGFFRATRNLVRTVNTGVPLIDSYEPQYFLDAGDDRISFTYDDKIFTIFDQKASTLGQDFYQLTNAESDTRTTNYFGLDLILLKKWGERFTFFLSFTAIHCIGNANPGNTAWTNDDAVIGNLFYSPNTLINAEGRLHFDRGYTARLGFMVKAPLGFRISAIAKYYDGQPFSRLTIIPDLTQGPVFIQTAPRGVARYSFNQTLDVRVEKSFAMGPGRLKFMLDGFNILNLALDTEEQFWTGPDYPQRHPTEIQSPRVFRLGMAYEF